MKMKAIINGVHVEGTPVEIVKYQELIQENINEKKSLISDGYVHGCISGGNSNRVSNVR
jgi:hypothetical protein